ncbi:hypothetical protein ACFPH6_32750 [Streptomyces xiangluensis]|uniref:Pyrroloquinoline-quinone binding quinoprotein n=1 Tax=Streptomyces xiangluensis TaxID=2665720 RepID=A0ABV8YZ71_9ACTN
MRLIPDDPFPEVGRVSAAAVSADGEWLAVHADYRGFLVYRTRDLALWERVELPGLFGGFDWHPVLALLAVGVERGSHDGELLLYEPSTRHRVSASIADNAARVTTRWVDERTLELVLQTYRPGTRDLGETPVRCVVERDDWRDLADSNLAVGPGVPAPGADFRRWDPEQEALLGAVAADAGRSWSPRGEVWQLEVLSDGRILAAVGHALLECRSAEGTPLWYLESDGRHSRPNGLAFCVSPDEETAWVDAGRTMRRISLLDGTTVAEREPGYGAALHARTDGVWTARFTGKESTTRFPSTLHKSTVFTPSGEELFSLELGYYNRSGPCIRRSPHLLFFRNNRLVKGATKEPFLPLRSPVQQLSRTVWSCGHTSCAAVFVDDDLGPGIVQACLRTGLYSVQRRTYPKCRSVWEYDVGTEMGGMDVRDHAVHVVTRTGELLTLRALDGTEIRRRPTRSDTHVFRPTSVTAAPNGDVLVGTYEGRILLFPPQEDEPSSATSIPPQDDRPR